MFVGENVKGLLTMAGGQVFDAILDDFEKCGYNVYFQLVNAKDFGVPQDRERGLPFRRDCIIMRWLVMMTAVVIL